MTHTEQRSSGAPEDIDLGAEDRAGAGPGGVATAPAVPDGGRRTDRVDRDGRYATQHRRVR